MKLEECYVGQIIQRRRDLYQHTRYKYRIEQISGGEVLCTDLSDQSLSRRKDLFPAYIDVYEPESDPFTDWVMKVRKEAGLDV